MSSPALLLLSAGEEDHETDWARPAEDPSWMQGVPRGRVLVVDDDTTIRTLIARILKEDGYDVTTASDGISALGAAASSPRPFNLVITDIRMPGMDGWELGRRMQLEHATPILYVSGYDVVRFTSNQLTFLRKPFEPADLLERVRRLLHEA